MSHRRNKKGNGFIGFLVVLILVALGAALIYFGFNKEKEPISAPLPETTFSETDKDTSTCDPDVEPVAGKSKVSIPCIDIESPLTTTGAANGWLTLPEPPYSTWYKDTMPIGSDEGHSLIASHVDHGQGDAAPFYQLHRIQKGDRIFVFDKDGKRHEYKATTMEVFEREAVPAEMFSTEGDPTLVLVTCSGPTIDSGEAPYYMYNLVVTAELIE